MLNMNEMKIRKTNSSAIKTTACKNCGQKVVGIFQTLYYHFLNHNVKRVLSAAKFVVLCIVIAARCMMVIRLLRPVVSAKTKKNQTSILILIIYDEPL